MPTIYTFLIGPDYLRAVLSRIDAKAEALTTPTRQRAEINARIAELENE